MAKNNDLEKIINGCKKGNSECFSRVVDIYAKRLYGYFYRLTGNRDISDDLLNELFLKLVTKIKNFRGGSFDCWLFKAASNSFKDHLRSKIRHQKLLNGHKEFLESQHENNNSDSYELDRLQEKLTELEQDTRELIVLRFYSQLSFKEISQMRNEPIGTTLSKLHRGLKKLRELMK